MADSPRFKKGDKIVSTNENFHKGETLEFIATIKPGELPAKPFEEATGIGKLPSKISNTPVEYERYFWKKVKPYTDPSGGKRKLICYGIIKPWFVRPAVDEQLTGAAQPESPEPEQETMLSSFESKIALLHLEQFEKTNDKKYLATLRRYLESV
jgi:hypothetical protein